MIRTERIPRLQQLIYYRHLLSTDSIRTKTSTRERNNVLNSSYRNPSVDKRNNRFLALFPSGKCQRVSGKMTQTGSDYSFFAKFLLQENVANWTNRKIDKNQSFARFCQHSESRPSRISNQNHPDRSSRCSTPTSTIVRCVVKQQTSERKTSCRKWITK
jgi:hypothetical protein